MDPLSVCASTAALVALCVQVKQILKNTVETMGKAKGFLLSLMSQTERVRLFLEQLHGLTQLLGPRGGILVSFNDSSARATIMELKEFVLNMAKSSSWVGLKVMLNQTSAKKLIQRLHRHEEEIMQVLLSVATASAIRTEEEIRGMREEALVHTKIIAAFGFTPVAVESPDLPMDKEKSIKLDAKNPQTEKKDRSKGADLAVRLKHTTTSDSFDAKEQGQPSSLTISPELPNFFKSSDSTITRLPESSQSRESEIPDLELDPPSYEDLLEDEQLNRLQVWFGDLSRSHFDPKYLSLRDHLSNSAFVGKIVRLFQVLADVEIAYGQSWANAPRLSSTPKTASGWTPLHQAVYMMASQWQIFRLVQDFGAFRLLRTSWTNPRELPDRNMTALDIAKAMGRTELFTILTPQIFHPVSDSILTNLQEHFHSLIKRNLIGRSGELTNLRLPDLLVLTELRHPVMWFPLKSNRSLQDESNYHQGVESERDTETAPIKVRGYLYRLDGEELLVKSFDVEHVGVRVYRISETGPVEIQEAIAFHI